MKKILALLLALLMVFALCACGNNDGNSDKDNDDKDIVQNDDKKEDEDEDEEETIVGKWTGEIDLAVILSEVPEFEDLDKEMRELVMPDDIGIKITFKFEEDGTASVSADAKSALEDYVDQVTDNFVDYVEEMLEAEGVSKKDFEDAYGMSLEDYASQMMDEGFEEALEEAEDKMAFDSEGEYKLDGNKLYFSEDGEFEDYFKIDLDGDKLTFKNYSEDDKGAEIFSGLVLKRK